MKNTLPLIINILIWSGSFLIAMTPVFLFKPQNMMNQYLIYSMVPILFLIAFVSIAGSLSFFAHNAIVSGTFPRKPFHPIYLRRRIYGTCWTQVYYFKPLYAFMLHIPFLKKYLFRIFGYKHNVDFVVYPDTWIRDLPTLNFGKGVYLSNRATIGTNICLSDGNILVDGISVGENSLIGHLAVLAPGVKIGQNVEIGVSATIAIRTILKDNSKINPCCMINHATVIGEETSVGTMSYIGLKSVIGPKLNIPAGANIPAGSILNTQEEVDRCYHSETKKLEDHLTQMLGLFREGSLHELKT